MKVLKGFVNIQNFVSNTPGVIAPIGELSTWGLTFTKNPGDYVNQDIPGYRLISFVSFDDVANVSIEADHDMKNLAIDVIRAIVSYVTTHMQPIDINDFYGNMNVLYAGKATNFQYGAMVSNETVTIPSWVSFTDSNGNYIKLWVSNAAFVDQYDDFEIDVIPPFVNLDDFFKTPAAVKAEVEAITFNSLMDKIQVAKGTNPETYIKSFDFDYSNAAISSLVVSTPWSVLIYGQAGDNYDSVKSALSDYILAHSTHDLQDWVSILPSIFKHTEFTILPRWDIYSIPNLAVATGIYQPSITAHDAIAYAQAKIHRYDASWIADNVTIMPTNYNALVMEVVNGPDNLPGFEHILGIFPDYIPVPTTSLDFSRMSQDTQEWAQLIYDMLLLAEKINPYTETPVNIRKVYKDNELYLSSVFNNVNFLMRCKYNDTHGG